MAGRGAAALVLALALALAAQGQGLFGLRKRTDVPNPGNRAGVAGRPGQRGPLPPPVPPVGPPVPYVDNPPPKGPAIVLDHADVMRTIELDGRPLRELEGNARVLHNGRVITFGLGRYDQEAGVLTCTQKVKVVEGARWLTADEVSYDERRETVSARGHVHSWGDSLEGWAERGHWFNGLKQGELQTQARLRDHRRKVELTAGQIDADHEARIYTATRQPELTLLETPPTVLNARRIRWQGADSLATAKGEVRVRREDFQATCDSLVWHEDSQRMEFLVDPVMNEGPRRVSGERMVARLPDRKTLDSLWVEGSARMDSPSDSVSTLLRDVLQGKRMELDFDGKELRSVYVDGQARSVIFLKDEEGRPGMNVADAARIWLAMDGRRLKTVRMGGGMEARWVPLVAPPRAEAAAPAVADSGRVAGADSIGLTPVVPTPPTEDSDQPKPSPKGARIAPPPPGATRDDKAKP